MAKKKMTKKELKQPDEILTSLGKLTSFITENSAKILIVAAAVTLSISAIYGYKGYVNKRTMKENGKLWGIVSQIPENTGELSEKEQQNLVLLKSELDDFEKKVSSNSARLYAKYYIADINYRLEYYSNASSKYREILSEEGVTGELRYITNIGLGYSYEAMGKFEDAIPHFADAGGIAVGSYNRGTALYGMARCYELLGKKDMARQAYRDIIEKVPDYPDIEFIKARLSSIS